MDAAELIKDLQNRTEEVLAKAIQLEQLSIDLLNAKPDADSWSALECIEHLNRYGDFYLPEIEKQISNSKHASKEVFRSSWLGNYFAKSMLPDASKMNTFKSMNPAGSQLDKSILQKFIEQQKQMLELLELATNVDLTKTKTGITISKWIRLRLGDTFRVVIYHNQRHLLQAERAVSITERSQKSKLYNAA